LSTQNTLTPKSLNFLLPNTINKTTYTRSEKSLNAEPNRTHSVNTLHGVQMQETVT